MVVVVMSTQCATEPQEVSKYEPPSLSAVVLGLRTAVLRKRFARVSKSCKAHIQS